MGLNISAIVLGVSDINRAKEFYRDGLGCKIEQDHGQYVEFSLDGGPKFALYSRAALANDAGVDAEGSGFAGVTFHHFTSSIEEVDQLLAQAEKAGGAIVRPAQKPQWSSDDVGYFGYFSDPDGNLWKVVKAA